VSRSESSGEGANGRQTLQQAGATNDCGDAAPQSLDFDSRKAVGTYAGWHPRRTPCSALGRSDAVKGHEFRPYFLISRTKNVPRICSFAGGRAHTIRHPK
jgi:hypothetical protein